MKALAHLFAKAQAVVLVVALKMMVFQQFLVALGLQDKEMQEVLRQVRLALEAAEQERQVQMPLHQQLLAVSV
jgi:hypothetical protein